VIDIKVTVCKKKDVRFMIKECREPNNYFPEGYNIKMMD